METKDIKKIPPPSFQEITEVIFKFLMLWLVESSIWQHSETAWGGWQLVYLFFFLKTTLKNLLSIQSTAAEKENWDVSLQQEDEWVTSGEVHKV